MKRQAIPFDGITVIVPDQTGKTEPIHVENKMDQIPDLPKEKGKFRKIRTIANIAVIYEGKTLKKFDPPIELRVVYNYGDLVKVKHNIRDLKLAYWDGEKYVVFTEVDNDYLIHKPTSTTGLLAECKIHKWAGDPPIIWGR